MIQRAQPKRRSKRPPAVKKETVRVAVYCRQSVDRSEEMEFGSLDAQRQSVEHYVAIHAEQGWTALPERYDDGGFSGATTDRPAFQRLLADVEAGLVDVVAVYRLDRLSRSLLDFAKLMQLFDASGVSFVSVTEHFDTSTPMGRMVLNLLATFAQFERESTAQRTRDKVHAARRRGMWTGGRPILGYDVRDKKLVVNEQEAERVRAVFELYIERGSLLAVVEELQRRGWRNKTLREIEGAPFLKSTVHHLLTNPLYAGRIRAGDEVVDAQHEAIVDEATWNAVKEQLASGAHDGERRAYRPTATSGLLAGLVTCAVCGSGFNYTFAGGKQRRWRYIVCGRALKHGAKACPGSRVPAGAFEAFIFEKIRALGRDRSVQKAAMAACPRGTDPEELRVALRELDGVWSELFPQERARVVALLIEEIRFDARSGDCSITFREGAPAALTKS